MKNNVTITYRKELCIDMDNDDDEIESQKILNSSGTSGAGIISLIIIIALCWWGYSLLFKKDYSKPWWNGVANQEVCDAFDGNQCYTLSVNSDGQKITQVNFPNGGYITPASSSCDKEASGGKFCTFFEDNGKEWDVFPLE